MVNTEMLIVPFLGLNGTKDPRILQVHKESLLFTHFFK